MSTRSRKVLLGGILLASIGLLYLSRHPFGRGGRGNATMDISTTTVTALELPAVENKAFSIGEKLTYNVIFKGVTVGHTVIEVKPGAPLNGRPTWQYISTSRSTKFFDAFFKVRDENVSTVDAASLFSVAFYQNLHEGKYQAVRHYNFDYQQGVFSSTEKKKTGTKTKAGPLDAPFYDVLSALYAARARPLTPGRELKMAIFRNDKGIPLSIKVDGVLKELTTVPFGKVNCLRVEPMIQGDLLFKDKDNRLVVWMTNDEKKIPVLIEATIGAGLIRVKLDKVENQPPLTGS